MYNNFHVYDLEKENNEQPREKKTKLTTFLFLLCICLFEFLRSVNDNSVDHIYVHVVVMIV